MGNPNWTIDELILALDFYFQNRESLPIQDSEEILTLSQTLRKFGIKFFGKINSDHRNQNSVYMKLMNFVYHDPYFQGQGLDAGGKLTEEIWIQYKNKKTLLKKTAKAIKILTLSNKKFPPTDIFDQGESESTEGALLSSLHKYYERNKTLKPKKIKRFKEEFGEIFCEACGFNFEKTYGSRGNDFAECHHIKPISELGPNYKTQLDELALLCSNCHRMVHRKKPWLAMVELKNLLEKSKAKLN